MVKYLYILDNFYNYVCFYVNSYVHIMYYKTNMEVVDHL